MDYINASLSELRAEVERLEDLEFENSLKSVDEQRILTELGRRRDNKEEKLVALATDQDLKDEIVRREQLKMDGK